MVFTPGFVPLNTLEALIRIYFLRGRRYLTDGDPAYTLVQVVTKTKIGELGGGLGNVKSPPSATLAKGGEG